MADGTETDMERQENFKLSALRRKLEVATAALERLEAAAEYFVADQSRATDPRVGLVQPVSVEECVELYCAWLQGQDALAKIREEE
jgi:hypothetical protein